MFRRVLPVALALLSVLSFRFPVSAAPSSNPPLIILLRNPKGGSAGDLFSLMDTGTGKLARLTNYGYNLEPNLSPDGKTVAYSSYSTQYVEAGGRSGYPSTNIWLLDLATDRGTRIAAQPDSTQPEAQYHVERSSPRWSPDGKLLAWEEVTEGTPVGGTRSETPDRLVVYDWGSKTTRTLAQGAQYGIGVSAPGWGSAGVAMILGDKDGGRHLHAYSPAGKSLYETKLADNEGDWQWRWITLDGDASYLLVGTRLIDIRTGKETDPPPSFVVQSPAGVSGITFTSTAAFGQADWSIVLPGHPAQIIGQFDNVDNPLSVLAIAPDGTQAAYIMNSSLVVVSIDGKTNTIQTDQEPLALSWGPLVMVGQQN